MSERQGGGQRPLLQSWSSNKSLWPPHQALLGLVVRRGGPPSPPPRCEGVGFTAFPGGAVSRPARAGTTRNRAYTRNQPRVLDAPLGKAGRGAQDKGCRQGALWWRQPTSPRVRRRLQGRPGRSCRPRPDPRAVLLSVTPLRAPAATERSHSGRDPLGSLSAPPSEQTPQCPVTRPLVTVSGTDAPVLGLWAAGGQWLNGGPLGRACPTAPYRPPLPGGRQGEAPSPHCPPSAPTLPLELGQQRGAPCRTCSRKPGRLPRGGLVLAVS